MIALAHYELCDYYRELAIKTGFAVELSEITEMLSEFKSINFFIDFIYAVFQGKFDKLLMT